jgi:hypothetical protein
MRLYLDDGQLTGYDVLDDSALSFGHRWSSTSGTGPHHTRARSDAHWRTGYGRRIDPSSLTRATATPCLAASDVKVSRAVLAWLQENAT